MRILSVCMHLLVTGRAPAATRLEREHIQNNMQMECPTENGDFNFTRLWVHLRLNTQRRLLNGCRKVTYVKEYIMQMRNNVTDAGADHSKHGRGKPSRAGTGKALSKELHWVAVAKWAISGDETFEQRTQRNFSANYIWEALKKRKALLFN